MAGNPSLLTKDSKTYLDSPFVKISVTCSFDGMYDMQITLLSNFSLMKCLSISTCFVLSCWTGLFAMLIAALLLLYSFIGFLVFIFNSSSNRFNRRSSHIP
ncbi:hypothetical protein TorRG33x02_275870 [Trema orientale]|uniref:Transmembrane protein n=1 Tax=Trema orientale TaxID=63057 RepID=A0A2P5CRC3_TREOI|nr:hypothetical protein TorRG33x02_275870 [Trema orientale]